MIRPVIVGILIGLALCVAGVALHSCAGSTRVHVDECPPMIGPEPLPRVTEIEVVDVTEREEWVL